jgi:uncharacterized membrane protein YqaE (UPF0057 family)
VDTNTILIGLTILAAIYFVISPPRTFSGGVIAPQIPVEPNPTIPYAMRHPAPAIATPKPIKLRKHSTHGLLLFPLAILLPPVAVLFCGRPMQALLNLVLTLFLVIPGIIHAILVVNAYHADQRTNRLIDAIGTSMRTS